MTVSARERRLLIFLAIFVVVLVIWKSAQPSAETVEASVDRTALAERRLAQLRTISSTVPAKEAQYEDLSKKLNEREKGLVVAETAEQAQAQLLQIVRRLGKNEGIDTRGGEFPPIQPLGEDYAEVSVAVSFSCRIEQLVNLMSALTSEPTLLATREVRVSSSSTKDKIISVRLVLAGVVDRNFLPKKGDRS